MYVEQSHAPSSPPDQSLAGSASVDLEQKPRLFVVSPTLTGFGGHHYEYSVAVGQAALAAGCAPVILAHQTCEAGAPGGVVIDPRFSETQWESAAAWLKDLDAALEAHQAGRHDHILSQATLPEQLEALIAALPPDAPDAPFLHLVFRRDLREFDDNQQIFLRDLLLNLPNHPALSGRCFFYCDTEELCEQYNHGLACGHRVFASLPIPFRHDVLDGGSAPRTDKRLTVTYLGDARTEKGYQYLPAAISAIAAHAPPEELAKLRFVIQSNYNLPGGEPGIPEARASLAAIKGVGVELVDGPFTPEAYYALLGEADVMVLPYRPDRYAYRSSGVLAEALAAGKVCVVPEGTWMAAQVRQTDGGVVYSDADQLGGAIFEAITKYDELSAKASGGKQAYRERHSGDRLIHALLERPVAEVERFQQPNGSVLMLMDGGAMTASSGASSVAHSQLRFLTDHGFTIDLLLIGWPSYGPRMVTYLPSRALKHRLQDYNVRHVWQADMGPAEHYHHGPRWWTYQRLRTRWLTKRGYLWDHLEALDTLYTIPDHALRTTATTPYRFVLLNYAFNFPILDKLDLGDTPVICETHDIQSKQRAFARKEDQVDEAELRYELELLARCKSLIAINHEEQEQLSELLPDTQVVYNLPLIQPRALTAAAFAGAGSCKDIVHCCIPQAYQHVRPRERELEREETVDLLYVSSYHQPNVVSLWWFYREVFSPYLRDAGVNLFVAGDIAEAALPFEEGDRVYLLGRLEDLDPLYAATKVVILPIIAGAGTAIKTLEALALGKPVVGTSLAFRGLRDIEKLVEPMICDDPRHYAETISRLLEHLPTRQDYAALSRRASQTVCDPSLYHRRFQEAVRAVAPEFCAPLGSPPEKRHDEKPLEYQPDLGRFNVAIVSFLLNGQVSPGICRYLSQMLKEKTVREQCREMFDALITRGSAQAWRFLKGKEQLLGGRPAPLADFDALLAFLGVSTTPAGASTTPATTANARPRREVDPRALPTPSQDSTAQAERHAAAISASFERRDEEVQAAVTNLETNRAKTARMERHIDELLGIVKTLRQQANAHEARLSERHRRDGLERRDLLRLLDANDKLAPAGIRLETDHPVATGSADHEHPRGTARDNTRAPRFVDACERHFGQRNLRYLDIGCAGGGLVRDFLVRGHRAIGLEGSDVSRRMARAEWALLGDHLMTCDATKPFTLRDDATGNLARFDVISLWEVFEHIKREDIAQLLSNIRRHLADDGLLIASVATFPDEVDGVVYHLTIEDRPWWRIELERAGLEMIDDHGFAPTDFARGVGAAIDDADFLKNPELGFHFVARRSPSYDR